MCCEVCWKLKRCGSGSNHRELRIAAAQALAKIDPRYAAQVMSSSGLEPGELAIAPLDAAPACPWVRQRRYERIVLRKTFSAIISSSWGKSSIMLRELSLGGGMGTKEDNLRVGSEANIDISTGVRHIRGQVLLRRARVNEVGFEIVNTDMESRLRSARHSDGSAWSGRRRSEAPSGKASARVESIVPSVQGAQKKSPCFAAEAFYISWKSVTSLWRR